MPNKLIELGTIMRGDKLQLPLDFVTQTAAILARRGAGKTYTALKLAEEMVDAGLQFCAIDPTGVMWGLRSSASGTDTGYPVIIIGGVALSKLRRLEITEGGATGARANPEFMEAIR